MLNVNFIIHDNSKAAVILALLKELPFVELSSCQEADGELIAHYRRIFAAHLEYPDQAATVKIWNSPGVSVCHSFRVEAKHFSDAKMKPYYARLRAECTSTEVTKFTWQDQVAHCLILDQYRFLYRLTKDSIRVFHMHDLSAAR